MKMSLLVVLTVFTSCLLTKTSIPMDPKNIDFNRIERYAQLASDAYLKADEIKEKYSVNLLYLNLIKAEDVQFFLVKNDEKKQVTLSVRGTANFKNALVDGDYVKEKDPLIDIYLHKGFMKSAQSIYEEIKPLIASYHKNGYTFNLTGHSLGGAIAAVLTMYFDHQDLPLNTVITFGQPKVTNEAGTEQFSSTPLVRIVDEKDIVPLIPMVTLISSEHGVYRHFGQEIMLLNGQYYVYMPEREADEFEVTSFWENLGNEKIKDHFIHNYLKRIEPKRVTSTEVPYADRKKYE